MQSQGMVCAPQLVTSLLGVLPLVCQAPRPHIIPVGQAHDLHPWAISTNDGWLSGWLPAASPAQPDPCRRLVLSPPGHSALEYLQRHQESVPSQGTIY